VARKVTVNVTLDPELNARAKAAGLNLSKILADALVAHMAPRKRVAAPKTPKAIETRLRAVERALADLKGASDA